MKSGQQAVLITGANGGIGRSLCEKFGSAGYFTIATDVTGQGGYCDHFVTADLEQIVLNGKNRENFTIEVKEVLSGKALKGLVNNAAIQKLSRLEDIALTDFKQTMDINLVAPMLLVQQFLGALTDARGSVVNIGSIHSTLTKPAFISYATSKAALLGLTRALAVDLGGRVRVNLIQPAATETDMLMQGFQGNDNGYSALKEYHPANRLALPDEISSVALFLASDECRFMTGSVVNVDGGIGARLHDPE